MPAWKYRANTLPCLMNLNQRPQYMIKKIRASRSYPSFDDDTIDGKKSFKQES